MVRVRAMGARVRRVPHRQEGVLRGQRVAVLRGRAGDGRRQRLHGRRRQPQDARLHGGEYCHLSQYMQVYILTPIVNLSLTSCFRAASSASN